MAQLSDSTLVIFGITGDLSRKKLIPALYELIRDHPERRLLIVGAALETTTALEILTAAQPYIAELQPAVWERLVAHFTYVPLNVTKLADFTALKNTIVALEQLHHLPPRRLFYCATAAHFFGKITLNLHQVGLLTRQAGAVADWQRIVYEKPFGIDLETAQQLNREILSVIDELQVFRIDHYLTKEVVENIAFLRFTNRIFEPLWNHYHIDWVQIVLSEAATLSANSTYFDAYGTVRDVVQNHIMQLIALVAMDTPQSLTGEGVYLAKAHILKHLELSAGLLGQYHGYTQLAGINPNSQTETFAALRFLIAEQRWAGVPFYVRTGKALDQKVTKICIKFKSTHCLLPKNCPTSANYLVIAIYPDMGFKIQLNTKKSGVRDEVVPVNLEYAYPAKSEQVYAGILSDILRGDRAVAVHMDEIEASWRLTDQILAHKLQLYSYLPGSFGPAELADFAEQYRFEWV